MTDQHPITPPPELVRKWIDEATSQTYAERWIFIVEQAARWGYEQRGEVNEAQLRQARDQELEACCEEMNEWGGIHNSFGGELADDLRAARRPKPPTQAEQALAVLDPSKTYGSITQEEEYRISVAKADIIRRALERLKQLEDSND